MLIQCNLKRVNLIRPNVNWIYCMHFTSLCKQTRLGVFCNLGACLHFYLSHVGTKFIIANVALPTKSDNFCLVKALEESNF